MRLHINNKTMKKYLYWAASIFLGLYALFFLIESGYLSALFCAIGGLIIAPITHDTIEKAIKRPIQVWYMVAVFFVAVAIANTTIPPGLKTKIEQRIKEREALALKEAQAEKEKQARQAAEKKEKERGKEKNKPKVVMEGKTENKASEPNTQKIKKYGADGEEATEEVKETHSPNFGGKILTKEMFGEEWSLSVDWGEVTCENAGVFFYANGQKYAVNGTSKSEVGRKTVVNGKPCYIKEIDEIWTDDPKYKGIKSMEGVKVSIGPIISEGLNLCGQ